MVFLIISLHKMQKVIWCIIWLIVKDVARFTHFDLSYNSIDNVGLKIYQKKSNKTTSLLLFYT